MNKYSIHSQTPPRAFTFRDLRVICTHWFGEAWDTIMTNPKYKKSIRAAFEQTGVAATKDPSSLMNFKCPQIKFQMDWKDIPIDDDYLNLCWSEAPEFKFSNMDGADEKGSDSEPGESSSSSSCEESGSDSGNSSSDTH